ncbi:hypothetical protein LTR04_001968, partial [Oleoguttula sp. CCFEE 6159]
MQKPPVPGRVKDIGVSNFVVEILLADPSCKTVPAVNQVELHPKNPSPKLPRLLQVEGHPRHCVVVSGLDELAARQRQHVEKACGGEGGDDGLVWRLQRGTSVSPKSVTVARIEADFELDGWELSSEEMRQLSSLKERFKVCGDGWLPVKGFFGDDGTDASRGTSAEATM